ncbi:MAG TPA: CBS domain-containing protein [Thermodesulfovibrionales bacterium]|nr:CBS domain-containing protein [Thermodesulfovibrionales bacterium]
MPLFGDLFLSEVLKQPILDPKGEELGRLKDVVVVKAEPLPKVNALIIERKNNVFRIPWSALTLFNKRIISATVYTENLVPYDVSSDDLNAVRDLLDKQIVDVNGVKVVRVNDIKLEGFDSEAVLIAVDVGVRGILRRLGIERKGEDFLKVFKATLPFNLISWNYIQPLHPKLTSIALTVPRQMLSELHPADIADIISQVSHHEGAAFLKNLDVDVAAETLSELSTEAQVEILRDMDTEKASDIIEMMPPDEAADVLGDLPAEKAKEILEHIEKEEAEDIQELLGHEEDTAGGLMTNEFIAYPQDITVQEAIERFREDAKEIDAVYYLYLLDGGERLVGVISLRELLLSNPHVKLSEIMETKIKTVTPEADEKVVGKITSKYNLVALPVVDSDGVLLGIVTVDDILGRILPTEAKRK